VQAGSPVRLSRPPPCKGTIDVMADVTVFQFEFFDRSLRGFRRSDDYATAEAIAKLEGIILEDTACIVDESVLSPGGLVPRSVVQGVGRRAAG